MLKLATATKVAIAGKLVLEDGAYLHQEVAAALQVVGRGRLYLAPGVVRAATPAGQ